MRKPNRRFTVRRLMFAVAIIAGAMSPWVLEEIELIDEGRRIVNGGPIPPATSPKPQEAVAKDWGDRKYGTTYYGSYTLPSGQVIRGGTIFVRTDGAFFVD